MKNQGSLISEQVSHRALSLRCQKPNRRVRFSLTARLSHSFINSAETFCIGPHASWGRWRGAFGGMAAGSLRNVPRFLLVHCSVHVFSDLRPPSLCIINALVIELAITAGAP